MCRIRDVIGRCARHGSPEGRSDCGSACQLSDANVSICHSYVCASCPSPSSTVNIDCRCCAQANCPARPQRQRAERLKEIGETNYIDFLLLVSLHCVLLTTSRACVCDAVSRICDASNILGTSCDGCISHYWHQCLTTQTAAEEQAATERDALSRSAPAASSAAAGGRTTPAATATIRVRHFPGQCLNR